MRSPALPSSERAKLAIGGGSGGGIKLDGDLTFQCILNANSIDLFASIITAASTAGLAILAFKAWQATKPQVKILIEEEEVVASTQPTGHSGPPFKIVEWMVSIFNTGALKVTLISFGIELERSSERPLYFKRGVEAMKDLEPAGRPEGGRFSLQPIIKELRARGHRGSVKVIPFVEDGAGRKYKSRPFKIDTDKFVE